ncbi:hypothetical protein B0H16DRAFT_1828523 [Mycena metata]|uniref:Uncharacterized protein n=1 Tax=Mycena metata TaxID=1033252 RepID=A0AAD7GSF9_9AGAR|nr:hypothetical protein B0H16DRAFT_1828523 [Mycena metata]
MLRRLPTPIEAGPDNLLSMVFVDMLEKRIVEIVDADLQHDINHLVKTHLLRNRLEKADNRLVLAPRRLRHYLTVVAVPAHRKALTGLLLGDHLLSVEWLRFCRGGVEDEVHTLFDCTGEQRLVQLRDRFLAGLSVCDANIHARYGQITNYDFLLQLVSTRKGIKLFANFPAGSMIPPPLLDPSYCVMCDFIGCAVRRNTYIPHVMNWKTETAWDLAPPHGVDEPQFRNTPRSLILLNECIVVVHYDACFCSQLTSASRLVYAKTAAPTGDIYPPLVLE